MVLKSDRGYAASQLGTAHLLSWPDGTDIVEYTKSRALARSFSIEAGAEEIGTLRLRRWPSTSSYMLDSSGSEVGTVTRSSGRWVVESDLDLPGTLRAANVAACLAVSIAFGVG